MKERFTRRNISFPPRLLQDVDKVLEPTETLSGVVRDYLVRFVAARKTHLSRK